MRTGQIATPTAVMITETFPLPYTLLRANISFGGTDRGLLTLERGEGKRSWSRTLAKLTTLSICSFTRPGPRATFLDVGVRAARSIDREDGASTPEIQTFCF